MGIKNITLRASLGAIRNLLCAALLTLATGFNSGSESHMVARPKNEPISASYFSMNILFHPLNRVPWPSTPLGGWRTSHVNWADIQLKRDRWDFSLLDKYVAWSIDHKTPILMPLTYTPRWASSTPDAPTDVENGNPPGLSGPPRDMEDWRVFVRTVAARYKGRIHDWEIWNEPNRPQSWTGSAETMVAMTREAYVILKEIDPHCTVVSPAPTGASGLAFLDEFLNRGGAQYADVIGYHFYVGHDDSPEAMVPLIDNVKAIMQRHGLGDKPLWNTEAGWLGPNPLPQDMQSAYVARAYILNWANGVSRFYWYAWENHHGTQIELVDRDNSTLTPAGNAFAAIQVWMTGATMTGCTNSTDGTWVCDLRTNVGISHILWNTKHTTTVPISENWQASYANSLAGGKIAIRQRSITIGPQPVLVQ